MSDQARDGKAIIEAIKSLSMTIDDHVPAETVLDVSVKIW